MVMEVNETDLLSRLRAERPEPTPDDEQDSELLAGLRQERREMLAREQVVRQEGRLAETEATNLGHQANLSSARASVARSHAEEMQAQLAARQAEMEKNVLDIQGIYGCTEEVARRILNYPPKAATGILPVPLATGLPPPSFIGVASPPPAEQRQTVSGIQELVEGIRTLRTLESEIKGDLTARRGGADDGQSPGAPSLSADQILIAKLNEANALRGAIIETARGMGLVNPSEVQAAAAPRTMAETLIDFTNLNQVPASIAVEFWKIDREHARQLKELEGKQAVEIRRIEMFDGWRQFLDKNFNFSTWGKLMAGGAAALQPGAPVAQGAVPAAAMPRQAPSPQAPGLTPQQPAPTDGRDVTTGQGEDDVRTIVCPVCGQPGILATKRMIRERQTVTCLECAKPFELIGA